MVIKAEIKIISILKGAAGSMAARGRGAASALKGLPMGLLPGGGAREGGFGGSKAAGALFKAFDSTQRQLQKTTGDTANQLGLFSRIMKLFNQQFYDMLRVLGVRFKSIAGIRLGASIGQKLEGGGGEGGKGGGLAQGLSGLFGKGAPKAASGGGGAAGGGAAASGAAGAAMGAAIAGAIVLGLAKVGGAAGSKGFKAVGLDEGTGKWTGALAAVLGVTLSPYLAPLVIAAGLLVGLAKKAVKNSEVAKALREEANKTLGSVVDTILFGIYFLVDKLGIIEKVVAALEWLKGNAGSIAEGIWSAVTFFADLPNAIGLKFVESLGTLKPDLDSIGLRITAMGDGISGGFQTLLGGLKTGIDTIPSILSAEFEFRKAQWVGLWEWLKGLPGSISTAFQESVVGQALASGLTSLQDFLTGVGGAIPSAAQTLADAMNLAGKFSPTELVDFAQDLDLSKLSFMSKLNPLDLFDLNKKPSFEDLLDVSSKMDLGDLVDFSGLEDKLVQAFKSAWNSAKSEVSGWVDTIRGG